MENDRVVIPGSELKPQVGERVVSPASGSQELTVTVLLRRNPNASGPSEQDLLSGNYQASQQGQATARAAIAADPADVSAVRSFAEQNGLKIVSEDPESRRVRLEGSVSNLEKAFDVRLQRSASSSGQEFLTYTGAISVPEALGGVVTAVLGLDGRPVAAPRAQ